METVDYAQIQCLLSISFKFASKFYIELHVGQN